MRAMPCPSSAAVQRQLCVVRKRLAETGELAMHLEGDQERSLGVVLVGDGRPEEREQKHRRRTSRRSRRSGRQCC